MPVYDYLCKKCKRKFEAFVWGNELASCSHCGSAKTERCFTLPELVRIDRVDFSRPEFDFTLGPRGTKERKRLEQELREGKLEPVPWAKKI